MKDCMRIAILRNDDFSHRPPGLDRRSEDAVLGVAAAFQQALSARGAAAAVEPVAHDPSSVAQRLAQERPDLVVNLCESLGGDPRGEMLVPGLLDLLGVPYTGSGPLTLALALHKHMAKDLLRARGVPTPDYRLVDRVGGWREVDLPFPLIVKPAREDASIGIDRRSLVHSASALAEACERVLLQHAQPALVESYIEGRELNVSLLGPSPARVLPLAEIDFSQLAPDHPRIVTYACKWDESAPEFHATPPVRCSLSMELGERVSATALAAFEALECRDYARVDMRLSRDGTPYVIEVNPNCDLSPGAGFARAARAFGLEYEDLVWRLVEIALDRDPDHPSSGASRQDASLADARRDRRLSLRRGELRTRAG
jgi:D-alanine-D-alanine ligase